MADNLTDNWDSGTSTQALVTELGTGELEGMGKTV